MNIVANKQNKVKILAVGDVDGNFNKAFAKIENINTKNGPFDFILCVGNFFGSSLSGLQEYVKGNLSVSVPVYILGPVSEEQVKHYSNINGCEICPNVIYLGKKGVFTTTSGLKIAYVSGLEGQSSPEICLTTQDVSAVCNSCLHGQRNFKGIDILLTSGWPKDITNFHKDRPAVEILGSHKVAWLASHLKPRYHFCGLEGIYYERPPYRNNSIPDNPSQHCTRFIALAKAFNKEKKKWLYALSIEPLDKMKLSDLYQQTTDDTECPYSLDLLGRDISSKKQEKSQFFYNMDDSDVSEEKKRKNFQDGGNKQKRPAVDQYKCWFCLSSPDVEKHLIVSIGNEVYLTLPKGGLVSDHLIISSVSHHRSVSDVPETALKEIKKFKKAIKKFYLKEKKFPVFFERNYKTYHLQVHAIPVSEELVPKLKEALQEAAEGEEFLLSELPEHSRIDQVAPPGNPYIYIEIPSGEKLFHRIRKQFPLQFVREVLASQKLMNLEDRSDWRNVIASFEEESELAQKIRSDFKPFDFTVK